MNEIVFEQSPASTTVLRHAFGTRGNRQSSAFYGYSLLLIAMGIGWLLRDQGLIDPQDGLGYWLGIVGGSMMLLLLLYPLRKRIKALRLLGSTTHWFRTHMILGLVGPLLVLYHSNFHLGSFNSQVALYCMLLVAGSGIVGRHLYARIHRGLYGDKTSLAELRNDLTRSLEQNHGLATLLPKYVARLEALSAEMQGDSVTGSLSIGTSLFWTVRQYFVRFSLARIARRELQAQAVASPTVAQDFQRLKQASSSFTRRFIRLSGRVAQFTLYERMFSMWHVLHMPLFFMLIISALVHVLAVHMY